MNRTLLAVLVSIVIVAAYIHVRADEAPAPTTKQPPGQDNKKPFAGVAATTQPSTGPATETTGPIVTVSGPPRATGIGPDGPVFGAGGDAHKIVFLCDATGSMINKMASLKDELNKTVINLKPAQSFDIIFYQDVKVAPMTAGLVPATREFKRKAADYLEEQTATGTTDPVPALAKALQLKPDMVYFVTDAADFPDVEAVLMVIKKYNGDRKIKINTILFVENHAEHEKNADSENVMKQIATESGGDFRWVEMDALQ